MFYLITMLAPTGRVITHFVYPTRTALVSVFLRVGKKAKVAKARADGKMQKERRLRAESFLGCCVCVCVSVHAGILGKAIRHKTVDFYRWAVWNVHHKGKRK